MRIAHFSPAFLPAIGGAEIAVHNLALQQHRLGHDVTVVTEYRSWQTLAAALPYRVLPLAPKAAQVAMRLTSLGVEGRWLVWLHLAIYQRLFRFDVWHVHVAYASGYLAVPRLKQMGKPVVLTCQGIDIQQLPEIGYGHRLDPAKDQAIRQTLQACDRVGAISASVREDLLDAGVTPERIVDLPNGADVERIQAVESERQAERFRRGWSPDRVIVVTVGRNHPKKGFDLIPAVARRLADRRTDFLWVIVGKGAEPIASQAQALGVSEYVRVVPELATAAAPQGRGEFESPSAELIRVLGAADVFAFPTLIEGMPLVVIEAMAAGLPIATTDAPGVRDVVEHEHTGLISPVKDVEAMARNVERLVGDAALRHRLGANGRQAAAQYRWSSIAEAYCDVYRQLVGQEGYAVPA